MLDKLNLGLRGHARPVDAEELGPDRDGELLSEASIARINETRKILVEQVDVLREQVNPRFVKEWAVRREEYAEASSEVRAGLLDQVAHLMTVGEGEDKKTLRYEWGETGDPDNPGTLRRDDKGEWYLLLDESLRGAKTADLFKEVMHEYGAWALLVGGGLQEKDKIVGAVIGRGKDGKLIEYKSTHVFDSIFRAYKPISG